MVFWGFNVAATKTLVTSMTPLMLTAIRIGTAGIVVLTLCMVLSIFRLPKKHEWKTIFYITLFNVIGHHVFLATGLTKTSGVHTGLILGSGPLIVMILSILLLKDPITRLRMLGFILGFFGILATTLASPEGFSKLSIGDLYIVISMITQAFSFILIAKLNPKLDPRLLTGYMLTLGAGLIFFVGLFIEGDIVQYKQIFSWKLGLIFLFSAVLCTAFGHMTYNYAIRQVGPAETTIFINLNTVFSLVGSALFLGERIYPNHFLGMILIFIGVFIGSGTLEYLIKKGTVSSSHRKLRGDKMKEVAKNIIFFDGTCGFCQWSIQFIYRHDSKQRFYFAPLQGITAERLLDGQDDLRELDSLVLYEAGKLYVESTAVLRICRKLNKPWQLFYIAVVIPRPFRNMLYRYVANRRHLFLSETVCEVNYGLVKRIMP